MKVLIFGTTGQVATELARRAPAGAEVTALGREAADLADPDACARAVAAAEADVVINAAAYTAVDRAEEEEAHAATVNAAAPAAMAGAAAARGLPFLHLSTDYVFDGAGTAPWHPDDPTAPLGAYGRTKRAGEDGIAAAGGPHLILRTSWVVSAHGANFVKTMLRVGRERERLTVVADQVGGPTPAAAIADALWQVAARFREGRGVSGTFHFAGQPPVSWADFARAILAEAGIATEVADIPSADWPTPAPRPQNSRLATQALTEAYGIPAPDWRTGLAEILADLGETDGR